MDIDILDKKIYLVYNFCFCLKRFIEEQSYNGSKLRNVETH